MTTNLCERCLESDIQTPATTQSSNLDYSAYALCEACAAEYDSRQPTQALRAAAVTVLDGYPVQINPGDAYSHAHLFVRGQYVHPIIFADNGAVELKDAAAFDGPRQTFTAEEITVLRALSAQVRASYAGRRDPALLTVAQHAQRVQASTEAKLGGMEDTTIYD